MPTESIHEKYAKSLKRHATTRKHPLQLKKKSRRGEIQKNKAKGFSGGASAGLPAQALRAATEKAAREGDSVVEKSNLERVFTFARTYFTAGEPKTPPQWQPTDNLWNKPRAERKRGKQKRK